MIEKDPYYSQPEVSNSDLSWVQKLSFPEEKLIDYESAYRFGTLIDCMITEPFKINYYKFTCAGVQYTQDEFKRAEEMKKAFYRDPFCKLMAENSEFQKVTVNPNFKINFEGYQFSLPVRCKWDLHALVKLNITGDIKSTTATTLKQFIDACEYFGYFRQRAWYMDIDPVRRSDKDILIGISKVNNQVFKVPIDRNSEFYMKGKAEYSALAYQYFILFHDIKYAA